MEQQQQQQRRRQDVMQAAKSSASSSSSLIPAQAEPQRQQQQQVSSKSFSIESNTTNPTGQRSRTPTPPPPSTPPPVLTTNDDSERRSGPVDVDAITSDYYLSLEDGSLQQGSIPSLQIQHDDPSIPTTTPQSFLWELVDYFRYRNWKKKLLTVCLCVCFCLVAYDLIFGHYLVDWITAFLNWMKEHSLLAVVAFIGIFIISTLIFIPPSILLFGAGFAFAEACDGQLISGIFSATVACFVGSCLGAIIAFYRARYMMRDLVHLFAKRYPLVRAADKALKRHGFRVMLLLRLCPLIPFNGLNYICGITGVKWEEFTLALVGILPWQLLLIIIGATAGTILTTPSTGNVDHQLVATVLIGAGLAFGVIALVIIYRFAKKELEKELAEANADGSTSSQQPLKLPGDNDVVPSDSIEANESGATNYSTMADDGYDEGVETSHQQGNDEEWFWIWA